MPKYSLERKEHVLTQLPPLIIIRCQAYRSQQEREQSKQDKQKIKALERELQRKGKALAETTALLVLRKKLNAHWEENKDG